MEGGISLRMSQKANEGIELWALNEDDVRAAIKLSETDGVGLVRHDDPDGEVRLVRNTGEYANVYVEYRRQGDGFLAIDVYAHRLKLNSLGGMPAGTSDGEPDETWRCIPCNTPVSKVDDIGLHFEDVDLGAIEGLRCPICGYEAIPNRIVLDRMYMSESMMEAK